MQLDQSFDYQEIFVTFVIIKRRKVRKLERGKGRREREEKKKR